MTEGLPPDTASFDIQVARHVTDALRQRGMTMLDLVEALRAPAQDVRRDPQSGNYVVRKSSGRFVFKIDPSEKKATAITVADPGS